MRVDELLPGARFLVVGMALELELEQLTPSAALVRPTRREYRTFRDAEGSTVEIATRPRAFTISLGTLVEGSA